jgi:hypothetical protein
VVPERGFSCVLMLISIRRFRRCLPPDKRGHTLTD